MRVVLSIMVELYASLTFTTHENALTVLKTRLRGREETKLRVVVKIFLMIRARVELVNISIGGLL